MVALAQVRDSACPSCGGPAEECLAPDAEGRFTVPPPVRCHRTTAIAVKQDDYREAKQPQALLWRAERR